MYIGDLCIHSKGNVVIAATIPVPYPDEEDEKVPVVFPNTYREGCVAGAMCFVGNWNNFLQPLIYLRDSDLYTLALGLQRFQGVQGNVQFHYMMAVATLTVLPIIILFLAAQRYFVQGIVMSGIRG